MKLVILDRDGVVNADSKAYVKSPEEWHPLPSSLEAIAELHRSGWTVVIATNQSGLARGLFDEATLAAIHARLEAAVAKAGGRIGGIYVCPHGPDDDCPCRKPRPGLLERIRRDYAVDLAGIPVIGDSDRDLAAAEAVGARPILVLTGNGERTREQRAAAGRECEVHADLAAAARALLAEERAA